MSRRAVKVKGEICDAEGLGHKLENKDSELKELKRQLKLKVYIDSREIFLSAQCRKM